MTSFQTMIEEIEQWSRKCGTHELQNFEERILEIFNKFGKVLLAWNKKEEIFIASFGDFILGVIVFAQQMGVDLKYCYGKPVDEFLGESRKVFLQSEKIKNRIHPSSLFCNISNSILLLNWQTEPLHHTFIELINLIDFLARHRWLTIEECLGQYFPFQEKA